MVYVYHPPILTVDAVIFQLMAGELNVLLIRRAKEPFEGSWALPGGYNAAGDTTRDALARVLTTKVGIKPDDLPLIEQLYTFDTIGRDPRGDAVSVTYMGLGQKLELTTDAGLQNPTFFPLTKLPKLAYDHADIVAYALDRLRSKVTYTNAIFALLSERFTMTQLQQAYEAVLGRSLDKRNFRKKMLGLDVLQATEDYYQDGAHRPALLYRFKKQDFQSLTGTVD